MDLNPRQVVSFFFFKKALYKTRNMCKQAYDLDLSTLKVKKTNLRTEPTALPTQSLYCY